MNKLIVQMQATVDGFVSVDDPELDWQVWSWGEHWPWDERLKQTFNRTFAEVGCILLSRPMIEEGYLDHWTRMATRFPADPSFAFAQRIVELPKVVLSDKLKASRWPNTSIARGGMLAEVQALKKKAGGDIITFGGVGFASALAAHGLVDEFQFYVNPAAAGQGRGIFDDAPEGVHLRLLGSEPYDCGIVVSRYAPRAVGEFGA